MIRAQFHRNANLREAQFDRRVDLSDGWATADAQLPRDGSSATAGVRQAGCVRSFAAPTVRPRPMTTIGPQETTPTPATTPVSPGMGGSPVLRFRLSTGLRRARWRSRAAGVAAPEAERQ
ncbi:hypothetical protein, partial [Micromonospora chalcea]